MRQETALDFDHFSYPYLTNKLLNRSVRKTVHAITKVSFTDLFEVIIGLNFGALRKHKIYLESLTGD